MSKLEERESRRKSVVGSIIDKMATSSVGTCGRGRPKEEGRELKKRISLSVRPSLYENIQKIAYVQRRSTSELFGELMDQYQGMHQDELDQYDKIKND